MTDERTPPAERPGRRVLLVVTGCMALVLGLLGIVLPLLPATPFVLVAAACFARTWPRMHQRLARSRLFGPMLKAGPGARYLPWRTKVVAIAFTWLSIGATIVFAVHALWLRLTLALLAVGIGALLAWVPSRPR